MPRRNQASILWNSAGLRKLHRAERQGMAFSVAKGYLTSPQRLKAAAVSWHLELASRINCHQLATFLKIFSKLQPPTYWTLFWTLQRHFSFSHDTLMKSGSCFIIIYYYYYHYYYYYYYYFIYIYIYLSLPHLVQIRTSFKQALCLISCLLFNRCQISSPRASFYHKRSGPLGIIESVTRSLDVSKLEL